MAQVAQFLKAIEQAANVVLDKKPEIKLAMTCLLARGHLLIEDVPGVGKTTLVRCLAKLCGLQNNRIQFTIDLLPADILGGAIFNNKDQTFSFRAGPIFTQMLLADELNRASPRTQSALLQAMEEDQVSIDGETHFLPKPFFLIATQNPNQQLGTFHLPESQLDRFLMAIELKYASSETEQRLLQEQDPKIKIEKLQPLLSAEDFTEAQAKIEKITASPLVANYVSRLLFCSRENFSGLKNGSLKLSTRAGIALIRAAKAWAFLDSRDFTTPEDVQAVLVPVLGHRLGGQSGVQRGQTWALELKNETAVPV